MTNLPTVNFYSKLEVEWLVRELIDLNIIMFNGRQRTNPNTVKMLNKNKRYDLIYLVYKYTDFIEDLQNKRFIDRVKVVYRDRSVCIHDVELCSKPDCTDQVLMLCGPYSVKGEYCSNTCSSAHRNILSKLTINPETGLTYSKENSLKMRETLENTIDESGNSLEEKRHKATSKGRLELTEDGITNAAYHARLEAERRKNTIDPETGMNLSQLYGQKAKEANSVVGEDGLTNFQRLGNKLSKFYETPEGKELKRNQSEKQRRSLIGKESTKNLFDSDEKKRYRIYRRRVIYFTESNDLSLLDNFEKRGQKTENKDSYELDHVYSVVWGFENDIPPYVIGHIENLQFIHWKDNLRKGPQCWMTKEELFERVLGADYDSL